MIGQSRQFIPLLIMLYLVSCQGIDEWIVLKENTQTGILRGKISIGPLCPDESNPPDSSCLPTAATFRAWATALYSRDGNTRVASITPDLSGNFTIAVPSGRYVINFDPKRSFSIGGSDLPMPVDIHAVDTLNVSINIDTGIR